MKKIKQPLGNHVSTLFSTSDFRRLEFSVRFGFYKFVLANNKLTNFAPTLHGFKKFERFIDFQEKRLQKLYRNKNYTGYCEALSSLWIKSGAMKLFEVLNHVCHPKYNSYQTEDFSQVDKYFNEVVDWCIRAFALLWIWERNTMANHEKEVHLKILHVESEKWESKVNWKCSVDIYLYGFIILLLIILLSISLSDSVVFWTPEVSPSINIRDLMHSPVTLLKDDLLSNTHTIRSVILATSIGCNTSTTEDLAGVPYSNIAILANADLSLDRIISLDVSWYPVISPMVTISNHWNELIQSQHESVMSPRYEMAYLASSLLLPLCVTFLVIMFDLWMYDPDAQWNSLSTYITPEMAVDAAPESSFCVVESYKVWLWLQETTFAGNGLYLDLYPY